MIFFIYGTDNYRCRQKSKELQEQFIQKKDKTGFNVVKLDGDEMDFDKFKQEALTVPFLGENKLIVISNCTKNRSINKDLLNFLKEKSENLQNSLIFIETFENKKDEPSNALYKFLKNQKYKWEISLLSNFELQKWVANYLNSKKADYEPKIIPLIIALIGNDTSQIKNEADKLIAYKLGKKITEEDVKNLVSARFEDNIFALTDAIAFKNNKLAIKLISSQLNSGSAPLAILSMISRQFKIILKVKSKTEISGYPNGSQIASEIGENPFVVKKAIDQSKGFSIQQLAKINEDILVIEKKLKNGAKNPELLFDLLVLKN